MKKFLALSITSLALSACINDSDKLNDIPKEPTSDVSKDSKTDSKVETASASTQTSQTEKTETKTQTSSNDTPDKQTSENSKNDLVKKTESSQNSATSTPVNYYEPSYNNFAPVSQTDSSLVSSIIGGTANSTIAKYSDFHRYKLLSPVQPINYLERNDYTFKANSASRTNYLVFGNRKLDNETLPLYAPNFYHSGDEFGANSKITYKDGNTTEFTVTLTDPISKKSLIQKYVSRKVDISGKNPANEDDADLLQNEKLSYKGVSFEFPKESLCLESISGSESFENYYIVSETSFSSLDSWQSSLNLSKPASVSQLTVGTNNEYSVRVLKPSDMSNDYVRYAMLKNNRVVELRSNGPTIKDPKKDLFKGCHVYNTVAADAIANALKAKFEYKQ